MRPTPPRLTKVLRAGWYVILFGLIAGGPWGNAGGKFKDLPNAEKVEELAAILPEIGRGGKIRELTWTPSSLTFHRGDNWYTVELASGVITSSSKPEGDAPAPDKSKWPKDPSAGRAKQRTQTTSPDGTFKAIHRDGGVYLENIETKTQKPVMEMKTGENIQYGTADWVYGEELDQSDAMWWSNDGKFLAFYAFDDSQVPKYELLKGWDELRTSNATMRYPKAGDANSVVGLMVFEVATGRMITVDVGDDRDQYIYGVRWSDLNELLYFRTNRRQNSLDLMAATPTTGATRVVVNETQDTWQDNRPLFRFLNDGDRFIWTSEKSGFNNLELRKLSNSAFVQPLTHLAFPVVDIVYINEPAKAASAHANARDDQDNQPSQNNSADNDSATEPATFPGGGQVWYIANSGATARFAQIHRVNLDGSGEQQLTDGASHWSGPQRSPDGKFFTATAETPTTPPRTVLFQLDAINGAKEIATLAAAPADGFEKNNLRAPELFNFIAADGVTPLWGELFFPPDFDATHKYPLLIDVYGGPGVVTLTGRFDAGSADRALGLLIAKIDNRGTPQRGKAFESATYLKLCGPDLDDQVAGVKSLVARPYVDASRVAMKGHSYGGTMSAMAVLRYPDIFCAGVAGAPVTDWRNYDTIYTERYMRTPQENPEGYDAGSAVKLAATLKSHLLLIHGLVDDNVHPSNTLQMAKAMQDAEVPFEMMIFPDSDHGIHSPAYKAKAWWFLAEHLGLLQQAAENKINPPASVTNESASVPPSTSATPASAPTSDASVTPTQPAGATP
jgi:dipeptidyl-peptidase-4